MEVDGSVEDNKNVIEYSIRELKEKLNDSKEIIIPTYQRGVCWKKSQKETLIDSLINHYPFGSILLYKTADKKYKIIDGLQRSNTVIHYYDKPMEFFTENIILDQDIEKIAQCTVNEEVRDEIRSKLSKIIVDYVVSNSKTIDKIKMIDISKLTIKIASDWPDLSNKTQTINNVIKRIINKFYDDYDYITKNIKIPALVFTAPEEKLPEIFERINSEGSKLNKYQIYAATWSDDKVVIDHKNLKSIIDNVKDRYDTYLGENGTLDDYNSRELTLSRKVNIFDMIYGFGKMISKDYPNLFSYEPENKSGAPKVESIGFNLINACLLQKSTNMKNLNITIKKYVGFDSKKITNFLINILECIKYVDKKLNRGIGFKGNKNLDTNASPLHTELQIVSIIASLFIAKYVTYETNDEGNVTEITINENCNPLWTQNQKAKFDNNVLKIYSSDLIELKWKGSGDSKLYNVITNKNYYTRDIEWDEFKKCLDNYFTSQKNERNERTKVANPSNPDKLILNLIYTGVLAVKDQLDDNNFEIEHLATKSIMKDKIKKIGDENFSLPISSIGNLCLLPKIINEQKGEKLLYQFTQHYDYNDKQNKKIPIAKIEKNFSFTKEKDFEWLIDSKKKYSEEEFKKAYINFLNNRFKIMEQKIKKNLFNEE